MCRLDSQGENSTDEAMYRQYQRRNSFGLDPEMKIHRIFQRGFWEQDQADNRLTLPRATATVWKDPLENPLEGVTETDPVTGQPILLGSLVSGFYAHCWTKRTNPSSSDWASFSHGKPAVRITTSVEKLLDRVMNRSDSCYMLRSWLVDVEYKDPSLIEQMRHPSEPRKRMEPQGALLALSAAVIRTQFSDEDEVRYLFDQKVNPIWGAVGISRSPDVVRLPFDWSGFVDNAVCNP